MIEAGSFPLPESVLVVKQEKISQPIGEMTYSEVECLGTLVDEVVYISDSEEADLSLLKDLEAEESENPFIREINEGTQQMEVEQEVGRSDETLQQLKQFETASVHHVLNDKQQKVQKENSAPSTSTGAIPKPRYQPGPKSSKPKRFRSADLQYIDNSSDDSPSPGKESTDAILSHSLNDDFSVFLSSQPIATDAEPVIVPFADEANHFTFAQSSSETGGSTDPSCFLVQLRSVSFEKNVNFEIQLSLPQYSIYNIIVKDESVKNVLNVSDLEFASVMNLLELLGKYEYSENISRSSRGDFITQQLDLFFSTQIKFKTFQFHVDDNKFSCTSQTSNSTVNVTAAIASETAIGLNGIKGSR